MCYAVVLEWRGQGCGPSAGVLTYVFFMLGPTGQELEYPYRFPSNYVFLSENHHLSHVDIIVHVAEDSEVVYNIYLLLMVCLKYVCHVVCICGQTVIFMLHSNDYDRQPRLQLWIVVYVGNIKILVTSLILSYMS